MSDGSVAARPPSATRFAAKPVPPGHTPEVLRLAAKSISVSLVLDPAGLLGVTVPIGAAQVAFAIAASGRIVKGRFKAKSLRRAAAVIAERGVENVAVIVQGRLAADDQIEDAGIAVQPKF
jgi:predicted O-methyltransferase YrrM